MDSEQPLSEQPASPGPQQLFVHTAHATEAYNSEEFKALHERFEQLAAEEEERSEEAADDLEPEQDDGNVEYKLMLCGLTMGKIKKRTTQMSFRLSVSTRAKLF